MARVNLIPNPSFKSTLLFWAATGGSTAIARVTGDSLFGDSCARVTKAATTNTGIVSDRFAVTPSTQYAVSAYIKVPVGEEAVTAVLTVAWFAASSGGSAISTSTSESFYYTFEDDWSRVGLVATAPSNANYAVVSVVQTTTAVADETFLVDAVLFEAESRVREYFENTTQAQENKTMDKALSKVPKPHLTGAELNADIALGKLVFNTIDEDGTVWVVTDIDGWWEQPNSNMPDLTRGFADGSYDSRGRWTARDITVTGVFLPQSREGVAKARNKLIEATDLVYRGDWLITEEDRSKASWVRLNGKVNIRTVNPRGRTEFSIGLRAPDPIKYEWVDGSEFGYDVYTVGAKNAALSRSGEVTVTNHGNTRVFCNLVVTGPCGTPTSITNLTTGQSIVLTESLVGPGATIGTTVTKSRASNVATLVVNVSTASVLSAGDLINVTGITGWNGTNLVLTAVDADPVTGYAIISYANTGTNVSATADTNGAVAYVEPERLEIDTYDREVAFNGYVDGARYRVDTLVDWIYLAPGENVLKLEDESTANGTASLEVIFRSGWLG